MDLHAEIDVVALKKRISELEQELEQIDLSITDNYDDSKLERYDNYRDCWNGAVLQIKMMVHKRVQEALGKKWGRKRSVD